MVKPHYIKRHIQTTTPEDSPGNDLAIPQNDFNNPNGNGFLPNEAETQSQQDATPNLIGSEEAIKQYVSREDEKIKEEIIYIKQHGLEKEEIDRVILRSPVKISEWIDIKKSSGNVKDGFYLVKDEGSFIDKEKGRAIFHCTALVVINGIYIYFDSMGKIFPRNIGKNVTSNKTQFQVAYEKTCGIYAPFFLIKIYQYIKRIHGTNDKVTQQEIDIMMKKFQESMPSNIEEFLHFNDEHVYQYIKQSWEVAFQTNFSEMLELFENMHITSSA